MMERDVALCILRQRRSDTCVRICDAMGACTAHRRRDRRGPCVARACAVRRGFRFAFPRCVFFSARCVRLMYIRLRVTGPCGPAEMNV